MKASGIMRTLAKYTPEILAFGMQRQVGPSAQDRIQMLERVERILSNRTAQDRAERELATREVIAQTQAEAVGRRLEETERHHREVEGARSRAMELQEALNAAGIESRQAGAEANRARADKYRAEASRAREGKEKNKGVFKRYAEMVGPAEAKNAVAELKLAGKTDQQVVEILERRMRGEPDWSPPPIMPESPLGRAAGGVELPKEVRIAQMLAAAGAAPRSATPAPTPTPTPTPAPADGVQIIGGVPYRKVPGGWQRVQ
jgi:hypothetical protein